jgi:hypothetical protein
MAFPENILDIQSISSLTEVLSEHQISTDNWGEDDTKTIEDLYDELGRGEAYLLPLGAISR